MGEINDVFIFDINFIGSGGDMGVVVSFVVTAFLFDVVVDVVVVVFFTVVVVVVSVDIALASVFVIMELMRLNKSQTKYPSGGICSLCLAPSESPFLLIFSRSSLLRFSFTFYLSFMSSTLFPI